MIVCGRAPTDRRGFPPRKACAGRQRLAGGVLSSSKVQEMHMRTWVSRQRDNLIRGMLGSNRPRLGHVLGAIYRRTEAGGRGRNLFRRREKFSPRGRKTSSAFFLCLGGSRTNHVRCGAIS